METILLKDRFINITNPLQMADKVKKHIKKYDCPEIELDLSNLNILDAVKVLVLSSAYHYKKYPLGKLKCHTQSDEMKALVTGFSMSNLEFV